jgi:glycosyltransferase involved in cell wall biosynthesis
MLEAQHNLKISYLLSYSSIFHLGAWRNSITLWTRKGHRVNLIQFKDEDFDGMQAELESEYNLIQIPYPMLLKGILYIIKYLFRILSKIGLKRISTIGDGIDYVFKNSYFVFFAYLRLRNSNSDIYIAGDPPSLIAAYLLSKKKKKNKNVIFWELELLLEKELSDFGRRLFKKLEKRYSKYSICAVEFGEKRAQLLRNENDIPNLVPIFSIPNSLIGTPRLVRYYYFNEKFNIPRDRKIVLLAGSIFNEVKEISDLWDSIEKWPDNFVLVLHSRAKSNLVQKFVMPKALKDTGRIFFDDDPLSYDKIHFIYASCDIGLILSRLKGEINSNLYYSDLSLGKLFHYLFSGVPVISRNLFGYDELIEKSGVGLCFDNPLDIGVLMMKIMSNEIYYKENCIAFSEKYSFEKYHWNLEKFIDDKLKRED